ncbi:hypothetical protein DFH28DRAFT_394672 [Melampsora americana]|nr:hypothetical protein DFH28DRAFT_394672 [Melampsora americana]
MSLLPFQLVLSINARHYRTFNLQRKTSFTVYHLKKSLGHDFEVPSQDIHFTLVSGLFVRDHHCLYNYRASDGNHASLDVDLSESCSAPELIGRVISFQFRDNPHPTDLEGLSEDGIQKVDLSSRSRRTEPSIPSTSQATAESSKQILRLTREPTISLDERDEDPFNISSQSFLEDGNEDDNNEPDSTSDIDDDLYSDDGEMPDDESVQRRAWPTDVSQLTYDHLVALASVVSFHHPKREIPIRHWILKANFQRKLLQKINEIQVGATVEPAIENGEVAADSVQSSNSQDSPTGGDPPLSLPSQTACPDVEECTKKLETMAMSKELPVRVVEHNLTSTTTEDIEDIEDIQKRKSSSAALRLQSLMSAIQRTRALVNSERRQNVVVVLQNDSGCTQ